MELNNRLLELRKKAGFSQEQLAEKLGVTRQAISKWESGQGNPDINNIIRISKIYNVSTDYLLKGLEPDAKIPSDNNSQQKKYKELDKVFRILIFILGISMIAVLFLVSLVFLLKTFLRRF